MAGPFFAASACSSSTVSASFGSDGTLTGSAALYLGAMGGYSVDFRFFESWCVAGSLLVGVTVAREGHRTDVRDEQSTTLAPAALFALALGYAGDFETSSQVAQRMVDKVVYDLPDGFYESFVPQALATDAAGIQKAARAAIDPRRLVLVVVGDRAKVEAPLEALNLGALRILSVDDVMGKAPAIE